MYDFANNVMIIRNVYSLVWDTSTSKWILESESYTYTYRWTISPEHITSNPSNTLVPIQVSTTVTKTSSLTGLVETETNMESITYRTTGYSYICFADANGNSLGYIIGNELVHTATASMRVYIKYLSTIPSGAKITLNIDWKAADLTSKLYVWSINANYDSIFNYKYKVVDNGYASVADIITASGIQNSTGIIYINGSNAWTNPECTLTLATGTNPRLEAGFWYFDSMGTGGHYYLLTEISGNLAMTDVKDL